MATDLQIARGTAETAAYFRAALKELGETQSSFARLMAKYGDDRKSDTILRNIQRMANGEARVSGEMRVLLTFMLSDKKKRLADKSITNTPDAASEPVS